MRPQQVLIVVFLCFSFLAESQIHHVKIGGTGDGTSWANAFGGLQEAIDAANAGEAIWIAEGTYYANNCTTCTDEDRESSFSITKSLQLLGGFPGSGTPTLEDRDWSNYSTVLSGDIGVTGDVSDNSYHVIEINDPDIGFRWIEGIRIVGGNANGLTIDDKSGAGIFNISGSTNIAHCTFTNNNALENGGAIYAVGGKFKFQNVSFSDNIANQGAAIYSDTELGSQIENCIFRNNQALTNGGALFIAEDTEIRLFGNLFEANNAAYGGAVYLEKAIAFDDGDDTMVSRVMNCTFVYNNASSSGSSIHVGSFASSLVLINTIFWSNDLPTLTADSISGNPVKLISVLTDAPNYNTLVCCNLVDVLEVETRNYFSSSDPFKDAANNNFSLFSQSMAANRGFEKWCHNCNDSGDWCNNNELYLIDSDYDILGNDRRLTRTDIGAYEFHDSIDQVSIIYVNENATGLNNGFTWEDAHPTLAEAFTTARNYEVDEIWIAAGTYQPSDCAFSNCTDSTDFFFELSFRKHGLVTIYGGFPNAGNPTLPDRDWNSYQTIISGEIGNPDSLSDNIGTLMSKDFHSDSYITLNGLTISDAILGIQSPRIVTENCTFSNNMMAIRLSSLGICDSGATIRNTTFINNKGPRAVTIKGGGENSNSELKFYDCDFINNKGCASESYDGQIFATDCLFLNNHGAAVGGVFSVSSGDDTELHIDRCRFINNSSLDYGGVIYNGGANRLNIHNSLFVGNSSSVGGVIGGTTDGYKGFVNCTFYNNTATNGGSIYYAAYSNDELKVKNSILWGHEIPFYGSGNYTVMLENTLRGRVKIKY